MIFVVCVTLFKTVKIVMDNSGFKLRRVCQISNEDGTNCKGRLPTFVPQIGKYVCGAHIKPYKKVQKNSKIIRLNHNKASSDDNSVNNSKRVTRSSLNNNKRFKYSKFFTPSESDESSDVLSNSSGSESSDESSDILANFNDSESDENSDNELFDFSSTQSDNNSLKRKFEETNDTDKEINSNIFLDFIEANLRETNNNSSFENIDLVYNSIRRQYVDSHSRNCPFTKKQFTDFLTENNYTFDANWLYNYEFKYDEY